ncbi:hypothetical protein BaRGS_00006590, partial [Batillaria attramentaria]
MIPLIVTLMQITETMMGRLFLLLLMLAAARGQQTIDFDSVTRVFEPTGTITSPNYPLNYPNNVIQTVVINPPGFQSVCLEFNEFIIEFSEELFPSGEICSTTNLMTVVFKSNSINTAKGFNASWTAVNETEVGQPVSNVSCPPDVLTGETGTFTSPNYPEDYGNFLTALYVICVPDDCQGIQLEFTDFVVEDANPPF